MADDNEDLAKLLHSAKLGEQGAVAELFASYRNYLGLIARIHVDKSLQAKADPSDLVQETMLRAYPRFAEFKGSSERELVVWLRSILVATAIDMTRRYRRTQRRDVSLERQLADDVDQSADAIQQLVCPFSTPSQQAAGREAAVMLANRLAQLPVSYREAIVLHYLEGQSIAAVAVRLNRTPQSTNSLLARALIKLRTFVKDAR